MNNGGRGVPRPHTGLSSRWQLTTDIQAKKTISVLSGDYMITMIIANDRGLWYPTHV